MLVGDKVRSTAALDADYTLEGEIVDTKQVNTRAGNARIIVVKLAKVTLIEGREPDPFTLKYPYEVDSEVRGVDFLWELNE